MLATFVRGMPDNRHRQPIGGRVARLLWLMVAWSGTAIGSGPAAGWLEISPRRSFASEPSALASGANIAPDASLEDFFEARIRPLLVERCLDCHGPSKQMASLRLDSRQAVLIGGQSGPAIDLAQPEGSLLIRAVRHEGDIAMPPTGQLSDEEISALAEWVSRGAVWPMEPAAEQDSVPADEQSITTSESPHWAFVPVADPQAPQSADYDWPANDLDRFILARLEQEGLRPSAEADRRTLIRRATFDLVGLPPSPEEVEAFVADPDPRAYENLIDRLLASPHYGERWARHWLDVARYADTKGYIYAPDPNLPHAYSYRDWVIRALNEDLPYDQFLMQQIAADQLPPSDDKRPLAALGFLTLNRYLLANEPDVIDDRLDVIFRGAMGLSVSCARCHDHKYDPIPTADYYSLYGVFAGAHSIDVPIPGSACDVAVYESHNADVSRRKQAVSDFISTQKERIVAPQRTRIADYLLAAQHGLSTPEQAIQADAVAGAAESQPAPPAIAETAPPPSADPLVEFFLQRWQAKLAQTKAAFDPVFSPWHAFAALTPETLATDGPALSSKFSSNKDPSGTLNPLIARIFKGGPPASLADVADRYAQTLARIDRLWQRDLAEAAEDGLAPPTAMGDPAREELRGLLYGDQAPADAPEAELRGQLMPPEQQAELATLDAAVAALEKEGPPLATVLTSGDDPGDPFIFRRGQPGQPGEQVPRRFLRLVAGDKRPTFSHATGRLELARAIASPANPLTARVIVNRVWMHHFGAGLVRTPSDFGRRGERPSHPELLDHLASRLVSDGWSLKALHRRIMTSRTYRQCSADSLGGRERDPENRLLWRANRRSLEFEALRDSALAVAGKLDRRLFGRSVDLKSEPTSTRRTVYAWIDRLELLDEFRTFDFADPDSHQPQRHVTIVPQQALYLLNGPFVATQASGLAESALNTAGGSPTDRLRWLYRQVLTRDPNDDEIELGREFIESATQRAAALPESPTGTGALPRWAAYAQVLLMSNEFVYVD